MIVIDLDDCGVCEKCIPVCPKDLIEKKGYTMIIKDGCDDCGICIDACPLGAIYEEWLKKSKLVLKNLKKWTRVKTMKKSGFFNKITIIDILIIICIIGAVGFAIYHMVDDDTTKPTATSFDTSTRNKILETYLDHYERGKIVTSNIVGTKTDINGTVEMNGTVLWIGESEDEKTNILIDSNGKEVLAGFYKDSPNADIFIDEISIETSGESYANVSDIQIAPMEISKLSDLMSKIPNGTKCEISTTVAIDNLDSTTFTKYQKLLNALNNNRKPCITLKDRTSLLDINRANKTDLNKADQILGDFTGQSSAIQLRIYNSTLKDIASIKSDYNVKNVYKVS